MLAIRIRVLFALARVASCVKCPQRVVLNVQILQYPAQPGMLNCGHSELRWNLLPDTLRNSLDASLVKGRLKLANTGQVCCHAERIDEKLQQFRKILMTDLFEIVP